MLIKLATLLGFTLAANTALGGIETISVPGRANPWLAGMTNGAMARRGDSAPDESPVLVSRISIAGGATYVFSASGSVNHGPTLPMCPPDGENLVSHYFGAENGIADIAAPFVSLVGVFLGPGQPDESPAPRALDFENAADRDYLVLAPALKQPFFIGDGLTSSGAAQQVIAPRGATRLYLGVMDQYAWYDNEGEFKVQIYRAALPANLKLLLHPAVNPTGADAVANANSNANARPAVKIIEASAAPGKLVTSPGPELHAYTAIELSWPSETKQVYQVQWTPVLNPPQWEDFGALVAGSGAEISVFDSTRRHAQGFYRVRIVQPEAAGN